jgi:hypothetical protein
LYEVTENLHRAPILLLGNVVIWSLFGSSGHSTLGTDVCTVSARPRDCETLSYSTEDFVPRDKAAIKFKLLLSIGKYGGRTWINALLIGSALFSRMGLREAERTLVFLLLQRSQLLGVRTFLTFIWAPLALERLAFRPSVTRFSVIAVVHA